MLLTETVPFLERVLRHAAESGWEDWLAKLIVLILGGALATFAGWLWKKIWPKACTVWGAKRRLDRALDAVGPEGRGIWLSTTPRRPAGYDRSLRTSKPIIVVANLKGGVGKTTITSNLLAHYANKKGERVLGIDLDFQGSLTANCLSQHDRDYLLEVQSDGGLSKAAQLIEHRDAAWLHDAPDSVAGVPTGKIIPTYYSLSAVENRVMVEWLLGKQTNDIRYRLAEILHHEVIQSSFDRILIDAPPRLTTGAIQALCAATHVLIPTILDDLSTEAVGAFADQLRVNQTLWPHLRVVGVVGAMTQFSTVSETRSLADVEVDALASGRRQLAAALQTAEAPLREASFLPIECFIPDRMDLSRSAGHRIAYASPGNNDALRVIREAFDRLGDEIDRRIAERS